MFRITPAGTISTLVNFVGPNGQAPTIAGLTLDTEGNLYGTTTYGGADGLGTVFKVTFTGMLTTLVHFNNTNGASPLGLTIASDGNLYGTTVLSTSGQGTVFKVGADGAFTTLVGFPTNYGSFPGLLTASHDGSLYGSTYNGLTGAGTVFRVTTNGVLTRLTALSGSSSSYSTALTLGNDGNFYGTTFEGGINRRGAAFRVTSEGQLTTLVEFNGTNGASPAGPLTLGRDGSFYGATAHGGIYEGTVFKLTPDGTLTTLAHFAARASGSGPYGGVTFGANGSLYGTTLVGGSQDGGVFFRLDLPPTIITPPASRTNGVGTTAIFMVDTFGTQPFSYQWLRNGMNLVDGGNISGASTPTLTLANAQTTDAGEFAVAVANDSGSVTSPAAVLAVVASDADDDGVLDDQDQCPDSAPGAIVDQHGCSIEQLVPCAGPRPSIRWKNHGEYVLAVNKQVARFVAQGLLSEQEAQGIAVAAAQSDCGRR